MSLFFDKADYELLQTLHKLRERSDASSRFRRLFAPYFHPRGIKELVARREVRLLAAMTNLIDTLDQSDEAVDARLTALKSLYQEVIHGACSTLKLNTARVLLQIMKGMLRENSHKQQLRLAHDLRIALLGHPRFIRSQLTRYHLLEMPEEWNQVSFDYHVHDANTKGRKSPTHLIIDAWIKGVRSLQVIYYCYVPENAAKELLCAAEIMGIDVRIGVEFRVSFKWRQIDMIWAPRGFTGSTGFLNFLKRPDTAKFFSDGRKQAGQSGRTILQLLKEFNQHYLPKLNSKLKTNFKSLNEADFLVAVKFGQPSIEHLLEFITEHLVSIQPSLRGDAIFESELEKWLYSRLSQLPPPDDQFSVNKFLQLTKNLKAGFRLTLNLSGLSLADVIEAIYDCEGAVTHLEVFNLKDHFGGHSTPCDEINCFRQALNRGDLIRLKRIIRNCRKQFSSDSSLAGRDEKFRTILHHLPQLIDYYARHPLGARIGSDSTGRFTRHPGMGLVVLESLPLRARRIAIKEQRQLPLTASIACVETSQLHPDLFRYKKRKKNVVSWRNDDDIATFGKNGNVISLGAIGNSGETEQPVETRSRLPYLSSNVKIFLKLAGGFIPAFLSFFLTRDWWLLAYGGAFIWLGITAVRNIIQSVLGGGGFKRADLLKWNDFISWQRVADSLLYTGLSVPLLDWLVKTVVLDRTFNVTAENNTVALFSIIAVVNGCYIAGHNLFRGLPRSVALINLFRAFLSIPPAIFIGWLLQESLLLSGFSMALTAITLQQWAAVISKTASDLVAGIVEGYADRHANLTQRLMDYQIKIKELFAAYTRLEIIFPEKDVLEMFKTPKRLIASIAGNQKNMDKELIVDVMDLLYFRMYQPQARNAFRMVLKNLDRDERKIFFRTQNVLTREREISLLFLEGVAGKRFSRVLSFYLLYAPIYLRELKALAEK